MGLGSSSHRNVKMAWSSPGLLGIGIADSLVSANQTTGQEANLAPSVEKIETVRGKNKGSLTKWNSPQTAETLRRYLNTWLEICLVALD